MSGIILEKEALKLSAPEKVHLIDALWQSLDSTKQQKLDQAWLAESRARLKAFQSGELKAIDGEEALESIEAELTKFAGIK